jgi:RNase adaptor protein for sRNA GlmZ degradation
MPNKRIQKSEQSAPEPVEAPHPSKPLPIIKVVGISGSGKSTLVRALRQSGYDARPVSQEHSNVATLWQQFDRASFLIFLYASLEDQVVRRQDVTWSAPAHQEEMRRLAHAREHADLRIDTGKMSPSEVYKLTISYLTRRRVRHAAHPLEALPPTGSPFKSHPSQSEI